jgi:hypothetical protein
MMGTFGTSRTFSAMGWWAMNHLYCLAQTGWSQSFWTADFALFMNITLIMGSFF